MNTWEQKQMDNPASWVIVRKSDGQAIAEMFADETELITRIRRKLAAGMESKYRLVPILEHLYSLNRS